MCGALSRPNLGLLPRTIARRSLDWIGHPRSLGRPSDPNVATCGSPGYRDLGSSAFAAKGCDSGVSRFRPAWVTTIAAARSSPKTASIRPSPCHGPRAVACEANNNWLFAGIFYGRYWARTGDPQLVDSAQRSDRCGRDRSKRVVDRNRLLERTLTRTRANTERCHCCHVASAGTATAGRAI
jgi:hypothetical protein